MFSTRTYMYVGWDSTLSTVICYTLDSPRIESYWGREIFRIHADQP
jgi:hypothetical protein